MQYEEDERQLWLLKIEAAVLKALERRPLLLQELQLLKYAQEHARDQTSVTNVVKQKSEQERRDADNFKAQILNITQALQRSHQRDVVRKEASCVFIIIIVVVIIIFLLHVFLVKGAPVTIN